MMLLLTVLALWVGLGAAAAAAFTMLQTGARRTEALALAQLEQTRAAVPMPRSAPQESVTVRS